MTCRRSRQRAGYGKEVKVYNGEDMIGMSVEDMWKQDVELADQKITELKQLIKTFRNIPFPCHDYMTADQWQKICDICSEDGL